MRGKAGLFSGRTIPRTLHFTESVDTSWETLGNWWNDSSFTSAATSLPTSVDEVQIYGFVTSLDPQSVRSLVGQSGGYLTGITVTVLDGAVFQSGSFLWDGGTINGNAIFNGNSGNYGTVNGNATFNGSSSNFGTVTGTKTCNTSGTC